ncbi:MAG: restriction endonuclease [Lachnospiraceae bacterium]|nr:restriction endonuclease [Lachnospiraceae bacterium]
MSKKGDDLESLVQYVYQVISDIQYHDIFVQRKALVVGKSGTRHEIDVYYDFVLNGHIHRVLIECKDWKTKVSKDMVMILAEKTDDIPNSIGIIISTNGFQKGASEYAKYKGIELLSNSKLSLLSKSLVARLGILFPDESVQGEPFWTIMEESDGKLTSRYINVGYGAGVDLFLSKKIALEILKCHTKNCVVRGVSRYHLKAIVGFVKIANKNINLFLFDSEEVLSVEPKMIEDYFIND